MMYSLVRFIIMIALIVFIFILIRTFRLSKTKIIISIIIATLLVVCSFVVPLENAFISFSKPETALDYMKKGEILQIAEGEQTTAILVEENNKSADIVFLKKTENKYKLCGAFGAKKVSQALHNSAVISIYTIHNTSDYYIEIIAFLNNNDNIAIQDSNGTNFRIFSKPENDTIIIRSIEVIDYTSDYSITINGVPVEFM